MKGIDCRYDLAGTSLGEGSCCCAACNFIDSPLLEAEREFGDFKSDVCRLSGYGVEFEDESLGEGRRRISKMECRFDCVWESGVLRASFESVAVESAACVGADVDSLLVCS